MIPPCRERGQELESPRRGMQRDINSCVKLAEEIRKRPWVLLELALAGLLIAWRVAAPTWHPFYLDILFYLGLYWILLALCRDPRAREGAAVGLSLLFLGIYLKGVMPNLLLVTDLLP